MREFLAALPDVDDNRAAARIEQLVAVFGEEIRALGPLDMKRRPRAAHEQNFLFWHSAILGVPGRRGNCRSRSMFD